MSFEIVHADPPLYGAIARLITDVYAGEGVVPRGGRLHAGEIAEWARGTEILVALRDAAGPAPDASGAASTPEDPPVSRVIGVVGLVRAGVGATRVAGPGENEVQRLAVARTDRRSGVGRALMSECIRRSRATDAARLVLLTRPSMLSAQRLYAALGFRREPERDQVDPVSRRLVYVLQAAPAEGVPRPSSEP